MFVNLTGKTIEIAAGDGGYITLPTSARPAEIRHDLAERTGRRMLLEQKTIGVRTLYLPDESDVVTYIVTPEVFLANPTRADLACLSDEIKVIKVNNRTDREVAAFLYTRFQKIRT